MADNKTISLCLKTICAAYPRFEISEDTVRVWTSFVGDLDDDLLTAAVFRFISSSDHAFPPSIPEIRKEATEMKREISGVPSSFEAWNEVIKAPAPSPLPQFRDGKFFEPVDYVWSHEVVGVVARRLGWPKRFPGENEIADRAHFVKAYDAEVTKRMQTETQIPQVTKYIETQKQNNMQLDVSSEMKRLAESRKV